MIPTAEQRVGILRGYAEAMEVMRHTLKPHDPTGEVADFICSIIEWQRDTLYGTGECEPRGIFSSPAIGP